jgi:membrane fusion protein (multidrug efflux system)
LYKDKFVSTADLEKSESRLAQAQAAVKQAQANLSLAEIDLKHTEVKSPISGRIGQALITKGNYVNAANGALARIVQTTPVKISFSITDKEHLQMKKMLQKDIIYL